MPDLSESLQGEDLGRLAIIAELWGLELHAPEVKTALEQLLPALLDPVKVDGVISMLPEAARQALDDLHASQGRLPWPLFTRRYGEVRSMGPGRRDREKPYLRPSSPAEILWYRALIARTFFDTPSGPEEFAYLPEDLRKLLPQVPAGMAETPFGRPATPAERTCPLPASDLILNHATTLLAALRLGMEEEALAVHAASWQAAPMQLSTRALKGLLAAAGLIEASGQPKPEATRAFLEAGRGEALSLLVQVWLNSAEFNELRETPGLSLEGDWRNDPLAARQALLGFLATVPGRERVQERPFWSLPAFIADIRQRLPDFQRPAGDYDSWFIRDISTGKYLRGIETWEQVEGALIRFVISGPLHWLGILDLAAAVEGGPVTAFRYSAWGMALLNGLTPTGLAGEEAAIQVSSQARLFVPRLAPRAVRYQVARFSAWEEPRPDEYRYRLIPSALKHARQQGLTVNQILALLRRHTATLPPSVVKALERWEQRGSEARIEQVQVLRVSAPEILQALRASRAARFLGDPLGPTAVIVKPGAGEKVLAILAELGYLGEAWL